MSTVWPRGPRRRQRCSQHPRGRTGPSGRTSCLRRSGRLLAVRDVTSFTGPARRRLSRIGGVLVSAPSDGCGVCSTSDVLRLLVHDHPARWSPDPLAHRRRGAAAPRPPKPNERRNPTNRHPALVGLGRDVTSLAVSADAAPTPRRRRVADRTTPRRPSSCAPRRP